MRIFIFAALVLVCVNGSSPVSQCNHNLQEAASLTQSTADLLQYIHDRVYMVPDRSEANLLELELKRALRMLRSEGPFMATRITDNSMVEKATERVSNFRRTTIETLARIRALPAVASLEQVSERWAKRVEMLTFCAKAFKEQEARSVILHKQPSKELSPPPGFENSVIENLEQLAIEDSSLIDELAAETEKLMNQFEKLRQILGRLLPTENRILFARNLGAASYVASHLRSDLEKMKQE